MRWACLPQVQTGSSQSVVPRSPAAASKNFIEMQILSPHHMPAESESLKVVSCNLSPPGHSDAHSNLRSNGTHNLESWARWFSHRYVTINWHTWMTSRISSLGAHIAATGGRRNVPTQHILLLLPGFKTLCKNAHKLSFKLWPEAGKHGLWGKGPDDPLGLT